MQTQAMRSLLAVCLASVAVVTGCSDGEPGRSEVWETCRDHIQAAAGGAIPSVTDFDASSVAISEQGTGWVVEGSASPDGGKMQFYCQLDADLAITDSIVTPA